MSEKIKIKKVLLGLYFILLSVFLAAIWNSGTYLGAAAIISFVIGSFFFFRGLFPIGKK